MKTLQRTNPINSGIYPAPESRKNCKVSLLIPTLNEAENLPLVIPYIPLNLIDEVILVDGHSIDGTVEVAQKLLPDIKIVYESRRGKGAALQAGYRAASGDIIVVLDADGSNDPREIPRFIDALEQGADFVKGSRFAPMGGTTDMPRLRKWGNSVFTHMVNLLFSTKFTDLCYGYHAFWRHYLDEIDLSNVDGFEIDTALYLRALRHHLRIVDVPSFEGHRFYGDGKLRTFPDGWRVLKTIFREWYVSLRSPQKNDHKGFRTPQPAFNNLATSPFSMIEADAGESRDLTSQADVTRTVIKLLQTLVQETPESKFYAEILSYLMVLAVRNFRASSASLFVMDRDGEVVQSYATFDGKICYLQQDQVAEMIEGGLAGWVVSNQRPAIVESTLEDRRWLARPWEQQQNISRSALGIPLIEDNKLMGVLTVTRGTEPFTHEDLAKLEGESHTNNNEYKEAIHES